MNQFYLSCSGDPNNGIRANLGFVTSPEGSESSSSIPRSDLPTFTSKEVYGWLHSAEQFMKFYNVSNDLRVRMAALYLEEGPLEWYLGNVRAKGKLLSWVEFEKGLVSMYDNSKARKVFDGIPQPLPLMIRHLCDKIPQSPSRAPVIDVNATITLLAPASAPSLLQSCIDSDSIVDAQTATYDSPHDPHSKLGAIETDRKMFDEIAPPKDTLVMPEELSESPTIAQKLVSTIPKVETHHTMNLSSDTPLEPLKDNKTPKYKDPSLPSKHKTKIQDYAKSYGSAEGFHVSSKGQREYNRHRHRHCGKGGEVYGAVGSEPKPVELKPTEYDDASRNVMLNGMMKFRCFKEAQKMFDEMSERGVGSWVPLLSRYAHLHRWCDLFGENAEVFDEMLKRGGASSDVTDVAFMLDDGTGKADVIRWVNETSETVGIALIKNGMYVAVKGSSKGFQGKRHVATFYRVPEIASSNEMVAKVPIVAEIVSKSMDQSITEECYEFLLLVAGAAGDGKISLYQPGVMDMLARHVYSLQDGARLLDLTVKLLQLVLNELPVDMNDINNVSSLSYLVAVLARQFVVLHNASKFDVLHLLTILLSAKNSLLPDTQRSMPKEFWASHVRAGITAVLQKHVVSRKKLHAPFLAEFMISILSEDWLVEQSEMHDSRVQIPVDKFMLLVHWVARVEVVVPLNELAYSKYEASKSSATDEAFLFKQWNLAITLSLIEKITKLIFHVSEVEGSPVNEAALTMAMVGLSEAIGLVFGLLQDSKDHGQRRGNDLLASVRIIGSYLVETPYACKNKTQGLLGYMLSFEGDNELTPFYYVSFLLPMLCQITMKTEGCKLLTFFDGPKAIGECLMKMIRKDEAMVENYGTFLLECETVMLLVSTHQLQSGNGS